MPSQVVQTIDELFPHAKAGVGNGTLMASHSPQILAILNLIQAIPDELINLPAGEYADLVLATSTMQSHLDTWVSRGSTGHMSNVKGRDAITVIRRILPLCLDEYPPSATTELAFINDAELRDSIRRDVGAANRASNNFEWKAATVLAGSAIEALLLWAIQKPVLQAQLSTAVTRVVQRGIIPSDRASSPDRWDLAHYIEVAAELSLLRPSTKS